MTRKAIIILGHSHVGAVVDALNARQVVVPQRGDTLFYFVHDVWKYKTDYANSGAEGGVVFNKHVLDAVNRIVPPGYERHYVSMLGGNGHILLSLKRHARPFDFVIPEAPDWPLETDAEIVPFSFMSDIMLQLMLPYVWQLKAYREAVGVKVAHIEPPPPCGDDEYLAKHLGPYALEPKNVLPRYQRLKLWRLHSRLLRRLCADLDVEFIKAPDEGLDPIGFLSPESHGSDAAHANKTYGELVLNQLHSMTGGGYAGFTHFTEGD